MGNCLCFFLHQYKPVHVYFCNNIWFLVNTRVEYHAGFALYISNSKCDGPTGGQLCYKNDDVIPPLQSDHICQFHGRYVTYYNERTGSRSNLPPGVAYTRETIAELCEVQVFGGHILETSLSFSIVLYSILKSLLTIPQCKCAC